MTYFTRKSKHEKRVKFGISLLFILFILICGGTYQYFFEGLSLAQAAENQIMMLGNYLIIFCPSILIILSILFVSKKIKLWLDNRRDHN